MTDLTPDLQFLLGEPLNAVSFVMDYVELQFNGSYVRLLEPPTIMGPDGPPVTFPQPGSRDALCALRIALARDPPWARGIPLPQPGYRRHAVVVGRRYEQQAH